jgi:hypothetical protein
MDPPNIEKDSATPPIRSLLSKWLRLDFTKTKPKESPIIKYNAKSRLINSKVLKLSTFTSNLFVMLHQSQLKLKTLRMKEYEQVINYNNLFQNEIEALQSLVRYIENEYRDCSIQFEEYTEESMKLDSDEDTYVHRKLIYDFKSFHIELAKVKTETDHLNNLVSFYASKETLIDICTAPPSKDKAIHIDNQNLLARDSEKYLSSEIASVDTIKQKEIELMKLVENLKQVNQNLHGELKSNHIIVENQNAYIGHLKLNICQIMKMEYDFKVQRILESKNKEASSSELEF